MDFDCLSTIIKESPQTWSPSQTQQFLSFLYLEQLSPYFTNINGSTLMKLTEAELYQMGVTNNMFRRKLLKWIRQGLCEFAAFLQNNWKQQLLLDRKTSAKTTDSIEEQPIGKKSYLQCSVPQMIIRSHEGVQADFYVVNKSIITVGRSLTCTMRTLEITVADEHAQIYQQNNRYFIQDLGTRSGTFLKITLRQNLTPNILIEIGSYLFKVLYVENQTIRLGYTRADNSEMGEITITNNSYSFGRKSMNDFSRNDQHMSGCHAKIYLHKNIFVIQDCNSTNGTWLRLSEPYQQSSPHELSDMNVFKIGYTITYVCEIEPGTNINAHWPNQCKGCAVENRNCVFLPCKHNVMCIQCGLQCNKCPVCMIPVIEKIQIYLSN